MLTILAACSQPKTKLPEISTAEVLAEKKYLEDHLYDNHDFSHIYDLEPSKRTMEKRLARINKKIGPAAVNLCNKLRLKDKAGQKRRCLFDIDLGPRSDKSINAYADGDRIVVSRKLTQLINKDDQLAFIIAHELAHSIMGHLDDQRTNITSGVIFGALLDAALTVGTGAPSNADMTYLGADLGHLAFSSSYEHEADYIALYIMKRAGIKISSAQNVWRMMAAIDPDSIYISTTHPTTPERFVMMRKTIEEIEQKHKNKHALFPEMKDIKTNNLAGVK